VQVFAMIGLPSIPVIILNIYSSYQLSNSVSRFTNIIHVKDVLPQAESVQLVTAARKTLLKVTFL